VRVALDRWDVGLSAGEERSGTLYGAGPHHHRARSSPSPAVPRKTNTPWASSCV